ncbi:UNVERIFIED_ORG: hypothetical protein QFZ59_002525 [Bacillus sp. B2I3]|nr:hypothetical protein [Bacillus sp. B2I3]
MTTSDLQYRRSGLRVKSEKDVNPSIRRTCLSFAVWLRTYMEFPIRVFVYLKTDYQLKTRDIKELGNFTFFLHLMIILLNLT